MFHFIGQNGSTVHKGEQSMRSFGPIVWDTVIPQSFKEITDLEDFKKRIRTRVPDNCVCRLCKDYIAELGFVTYE